MLNCDAHFAWCDGRSGAPRVYHSKVDGGSVGLGEASITELTPITNTLQLKYLIYNSSTNELQLTYYSDQARTLAIDLYTVNGQQVDHMNAINLFTGEHTIKIDANQYAKGTYILRGMSNDNYLFTRKWQKQ